MSEPNTTAHFIEWLEKQDPTTEYRWIDTDKCVIGRYMASIGLAYEDHYLDSNIGHGFDRGEAGRTYGDALKRARAVLSQEQAEPDNVP